MPRSVDTWVGRTDDTQAPPRVRDRVFERCAGRCHRCSRKIRPGEGWTLEHLIALINGGKNDESNLSVTCAWCLPIKNAEDVAIKAKSARIRSKHIGLRKAGRGFRRSPPQHTATREIVRKADREDSDARG